MDEQTMHVAYLTSNIVGILLVIIAMLWPNVARVLFSILFIWASYYNATTAINDPRIYLGYADLTSSTLYRDFIYGPFSNNITLFVLLIAAGQMFIGIFSLYRGDLMKMAMVGAIIFLLAIAPLGIGSAFPCTLIMAMAYVILLRKGIKRGIFEIMSEKFSHKRTDYKGA